MDGPGDDRTVRIESGTTSWLAEVRDAVRSAVETDGDAAITYLIAVSEIATNAEKAATEAGTSEPVVVTVDASARRVVVEDAGGGFDPDAHTSLPGPDIVSGRGLFLARAFCPELAWERTANGMVCTLPFP